MTRSRVATAFTFGIALITAALIPYIWPLQPNDEFDLVKRLAFAVVGGLILRLIYRLVAGR